MPSAPANSPSSTPGLLARFVELKRRLARSEVLLSAAALVFLLGGWLAVRALPAEARDVRWTPLVLLGVVGVPATIALNAVRFALAARIVGQRPGPAASARIALLATAANLLPLPGAVLVRIQALRSGGAGTREASLATGIGALVFAATAPTLAGLLNLYAGDPRLGLVLTALGAGGLGVAAWGLRRRMPAGAAGLALRLVAVEVAGVAVAAGRLWLALLALGTTASAGQAATLTVASVVASAAGVFPGGLGLREAVAAAFGPLIQLAPSVTFLAAALDRVAGLVVMGPFALLLRRRLPRPEAAEGPAAAIEHEDRAAGRP